MTTQAEQPQGGDRTDSSLVEAIARDGDVMAFELLLQRHQRPLFGFIRRQIGDRAEAEDLFQQTLLRIFNGIATCKDPSAFRAWAFGIAANLCRYEGRRQMTRAVPVPASGLEDRPGWGASPEVAAQAGQVRDRIATAIGELQPRQREVFVLYHYTHLSYDEISAVVGAPVGTVKSRMNSALTQLRTLLASLKEAQP